MPKDNIFTGAVVGWVLAGWCVLLVVLAWGGVFSPLTASNFGITFLPGTNGTFVVERVSNRSPSRAQLRIGDRIDSAALTYAQRLRLITGAPPGYHVRVRTQRSHGPWHWTILQSGPGSSFEDDLRGGWGAVAADLAVPLTVTIVCSIATLLVVRRPSVMTAALALNAAGPLTTFSSIAQVAWLPDWLYALAAGSMLWLFSDLPIYALLVFITRFPSGPKSTAGIARMRTGDGIFVLAAVACAWVSAREPIPYAAWPLFYDIIEPLGFVLVLAFAVATLLSAHGEARQRISWTIAGIVVNALAFEAHNLVFSLPLNMRDAALAQAVLNLSPLGAVMMWLALGYAVLRRRVVDIGFVLDRTLVYGVLTFLAGVSISIVDWLSGRFLSGTRLVLGLEAIVTVLFGLALGWIHARVDAIVALVLFRRRRAMERRIAQDIEALHRAPSPGAVDAVLLGAADTLGVRPATVYRRDDEGSLLRRVLDYGESGAPPEVSMDDPLARALRAQPTGGSVGHLSGDFGLWANVFPSNAFALGIATWRDFLGFAVYSLHADGTALDPDEIDTLRRLAATAAEAYQALEIRYWRRRAEELERLTERSSGGAS